MNCVTVVLRCISHVSYVSLLASYKVLNICVYNQSLENVVREDVCDMELDDASAAAFESAVDRQV